MAVLKIAIANDGERRERALSLEVGARGIANGGERRERAPSLEVVALASAGQARPSEEPGRAVR